MEEREREREEVCEEQCVRKRARVREREGKCDRYSALGKEQECEREFVGKVCVCVCVCRGIRNR
jgi:hypothetical protein